LNIAINYLVIKNEGTPLQTKANYVSKDITFEGV